MDLSTITIADFKAYFLRDFPYLPTWNASKKYKVDDIVYYSNDESFYICIVINTGQVPTNPTYWAEYSADVENYVLDADITKAFGEATQSLNQGLFASDADITLGYLYLSAHFLANDIRVAQEGIFSSGSFTLKKRRVANVWEEYSIPEKLVNSVGLNFYTRTGYGLKYLNMVIPKLTGHVALLRGTTTPDWNVNSELI